MKESYPYGLIYLIIHCTNNNVHTQLYQSTSSSHKLDPSFLWTRIHVSRKIRTNNKKKERKTQNKGRVSRHVKGAWIAPALPGNPSAREDHQSTRAKCLWPDELSEVGISLTTGTSPHKAQYSGRRRKGKFLGKWPKFVGKPRKQTCPITNSVGFTDTSAQRSAAMCRDLFWGPCLPLLSWIGSASFIIGYLFLVQVFLI